jgi:5-methylcytosine-specific restriction endonuclease McrA
MSSTERRLWLGAYRALAHWVLQRDRYQCQIKGPRCTDWATEVDHIVARADGGDDVPSNMRAACKRCNGYLSAQRTNAARWGYNKTLARYDTRM